MPDLSTIKPVVYNPSMEQLEPHEAETTQKLADTLKHILETTSKDYGHAVRSVHAKSFALLQGELTVLDGLPPLLAQGLFAKPGTHKVILRHSSIPGDILPDSISTPRGIAFKVFDVEGERVTGSEGMATQDFVFEDSPAFGAPSARAFAPQLQLLSKTVDKVEGFKKVISAVLQALEGTLESVGGKSATISALGGRPNTNPLGDTFFSVTPFLYGTHMVKFQLAPLSPSLLDHKDEKIHVNGRANAIREEMAYVLAKESATWELRVQFCVDLDKMPIENAAVKWDEDLCPFFPVARINTPPQPSWSDARSKAVDDELAFDIWHALAAHRPLGSINRVRKAVYPMSAAFRGKFNGCPMHEPASLTLPG